MLVPDQRRIYHKSKMYRVLIHILDNPKLAFSLYFKGGTCAGMLGWLDRFSVDLDFDLAKEADQQEIRALLRATFKEAGLGVKQEAKEELFFLLSYSPLKSNWHSTLKVSIISQVPKANRYTPFYLPEIQRYAVCQTKETMFANKLVAPLDRFQKYKTIAGRDIYDIYYFFLQGFDYHQEIITERTGFSARQYLTKLYEFIKVKVNQRILDQDLNYLLPYQRFREIRKTLKEEVLLFLNQEVKKSAAHI